jgi:hypothetical protein
MHAWANVECRNVVQTRGQRTEQHKRCWRGQDRRVVVILSRGGRVRCPENQKPGQQSQQARALFFFFFFFFWPFLVLVHRHVS